MRFTIVFCVGLQGTFTVEDRQKVFDVNVFGLQRAKRAALRLPDCSLS